MQGVGGTWGTGGSIRYIVIKHAGCRGYMGYRRLHKVYGDQACRVQGVDGVQEVL